VFKRPNTDLSDTEYDTQCLATYRVFLIPLVGKHANLFSQAGTDYPNATFTSGSRKAYHRCNDSVFSFCVLSASVLSLVQHSSLKVTVILAADRFSRPSFLRCEAPVTEIWKHRGTEGTENCGQGVNVDAQTSDDVFFGEF